ncbi:MAG: tripartite tricarboxylate transporter TctB family protein [Deltaproteobacteria bacterium]|nr:tripartite tricarboxylate transporter TctB family protein [Deltaproteobacteria bacterium]
MLKGELVFSILIFVGSLFLYWVAGSFSEASVLQGGQMGPSFWPQFILGCLILLSGIVSVGTIRKIVKEKAWGESFMTMDRGKVRFFVAIGLGVAYFFLLPVVGFIAITPLFMIAFMVLLGEKSKGWIIGVSIAMTAIIVILFTKAMYVPLPRGEWLFRDFSLLFY